VILIDARDIRFEFHFEVGFGIRYGIHNIAIVAMLFDCIAIFASLGFD
jgi:hypothetical protein